MMIKKISEVLDDDGAVYICYRLDGSLFNPRRQHAHTKNLELLFRDFLFAEDASFIAHTERALLHLTSHFAEVAQLFRLEGSLKKTEVLQQSAPHEKYHAPHITINGTKPKTVHQFTYLGLAITSDAKIDRKVDNRLGKANSAFDRLYKRVWNNKHLEKDSNISVIVVGNGQGDTSSNPGRDWLHFT